MAATSEGLPTVQVNDNPAPHMSRSTSSLVSSSSTTTSDPRPLRRIPSAGTVQSDGSSHASELANGGRGVVLRRRQRERHTHNGIVFARPKSEYISPAGISALDIRTRLRITEAELAIVQRELSDMLQERSLLEASSRQYEESWRFAVTEFGRVVEQKEELQRRYDALEQAIATTRQSTPEMKGKKNSKASKTGLDQMRLSLETQTRVAEALELERDRAYDDFEMSQVQLHTLFQQYQDLASSCSEVAREKDKFKAEAQLLRDELHRYDPDTDPSSSAGASNRNSLRKTDSMMGSGGSLASMGGGGGGGESDEGQSADAQLLSQQLREVKEEKNRLSSKYDQLMKRADQFQKQLYRAEEDRRQALATSEALTSLWQKKFDKAQNENYDLRQELLSAHERISLLQDHLAMARLQSRGGTPLRPSPPEGDNFRTDTIGRQSPIKAVTSGEGVWGARLNSSSGSVGSLSKDSSLMGSGSSGLSSSGGGGGGSGGGGGLPQRTSSFHGFNQVTHYSSSQAPPHGSTHRQTHSTKHSSNGIPVHRTTSLKSPKELVSPFSFPNPRSKNQENLDLSERRSHDDGGSWI